MPLFLELPCPQLLDGTTLISQVARRTASRAGIAEDLWLWSSPTATNDRSHPINTVVAVRSDQPR